MPLTDPLEVTFTSNDDPITLALNEVLGRDRKSPRVLSGLHSGPNNPVIDINSQGLRDAIYAEVTKVQKDFIQHPENRKAIYTKLYKESTLPSGPAHTAFDGLEFSYAIRILGHAEEYEKMQHGKKNNLNRLHSDKHYHVLPLENFDSFTSKTDAKYQQVEAWCGVHTKPLITPLTPTDQKDMDNNLAEIKKLLNDSYMQAKPAVKAMAHARNQAIQPKPENYDQHPLLHKPLKDDSKLYNIAKEAPELQTVKAELDKQLGHVSERTATFALVLMIAKRNGIEDIDHWDKNKKPLKMPDAKEIQFGVLSMMSGVGTLSDQKGILSDHKIIYRTEIKDQEVSSLISLTSGTVTKSGHQKG